MPRHSGPGERSQTTRAERGGLKSLPAHELGSTLPVKKKKKNYLSGCLRAAVPRLGLTWFPALPQWLRAPPRLPRGLGGCGAAARSSAAAPVGAGVRAGFLLATSVRSFPASARFSAEGKKLFTRDTARNCRAKLTSCLGEKQDPARCPGTRNPGAARRRGGGDSARPEPRDLARPTGARTRSSAGLGRTRPPPPQPRRAGIVSGAPAAPCARPAPAAPSRSRPAALAGRRPSVGQSDRPALSLPLPL